MLTKNDFVGIINLVLSFDKSIDEISSVLNCNFFESSHVNVTYKLYDIILKVCFTQEGIELIEWWMYDRRFDKKYTYKINGTTVTLDTPEKLWNEVEKYLK